MLLREHRTRVVNQMDQLRTCLDLINFKVGVYEDVLDQLAASSATSADDEQPPGGLSRSRR